MGRRVANTSVGKSRGICPDWADSPQLTLLDLTDGPLLADSAFANCVIVAEKTSIYTTIAIPVSIDSLYSKIHQFDDGAQERHNLLETILRLRSQPPKDTNPPNEVIDMIEEQMYEPSQHTHAEISNRMHHLYHCMLGTCVEGYHTITSPEFMSLVKSFHMAWCSDPDDCGIPKVELFGDWCESCAGCDWDDCKEEYELTNKRRCCTGDCCTCSEQEDLETEDVEKADDEKAEDVANADDEKANDEKVDDEKVDDEKVDENGDSSNEDRNEDSDNDDKDECSCPCQCFCTCECWCDHDCWRNDEAPDIELRNGCRGQDADYHELLWEYLLGCQCQGDHQLKGDDSEHAEAHLEKTKTEVEKKMKLVDQILMRRFGLNLHIVYSRVGESSHNDTLSQIVPLAFLYDPKIGNIETINTPPQAQILGSEANYYANAATLVPEPKPEAGNENDSKLYQEAIAKLEHAMGVLDLKSKVHPMQIQPFEFSTVSTEEEDDMWEVSNIWDVSRDREKWVKKCNEMKFPRWMALRSMEHASAE